MGMQDVTVAAALVAGLLSFFSPCVLPLVPVYLGYMTGTVAGELEGSGRLRTLAHAAFFVLGFGSMFTLVGAAAGLLGDVIYPIMPYLVRIGGLILIVFGLHMMGLIRIPLLGMDRRLDLARARRKSYWTSFLVGLSFAAGWTPCVGPVLSAILLLAADTQMAGKGAVLLATYSVGLGLPFLVVAGLVESALSASRRMGRVSRAIPIVSGILLILMGALLAAGLFQRFVFWLNARLAS